MSGLFFDARTPATRLSHMVGGAIPQLVIEFLAAPANRFRMQAGDFRHLSQTAMSATEGLSPRDPAALLFVQPAEQHIELPMIIPIHMVTQPTGRTTTLMNRQFRCHRPIPFLGVAESLHQTVEFTK